MYLPIFKLDQKLKLRELNNSRAVFVGWQEADSDGNGTLDLEEFKDVITNLFNVKFKVGSSFVSCSVPGHREVIILFQIFKVEII